MSNEFKNKSDYSVSVFAGTEFLLKIEFAPNTHYVAYWLKNSNKYSHWTYMNVYARRTGRFLGRFYRNQNITKFPR